MRVRSWLVGGAFVAVLGISSTSRAEMRLAAGANAWLDEGGLFTATFAGDVRVLPHFEVGGRGGMGLFTDPAKAVIPLDIQARILISRVYIEGNVGPWIVVDDHPVHAHATAGAGIEVGMLVAGVEVGWLDPEGILGVQLGLRF